MKKKKVTGARKIPTFSMCIITFYYTILVTRLARASFLSATFYFTDGEPLKLPESLESLPKSDHFPNQRHRWNTNEVSKAKCNIKVENILKGSLD